MVGIGTALALAQTVGSLAQQRGGSGSSGGMGGLGSIVEGLSNSLGGIFGGGTTGNMSVVRDFNLPTPQSLEQAIFQEHMRMTCNRGHISNVEACRANAQKLGRDGARAFYSGQGCPTSMPAGFCDPWASPFPNPVQAAGSVGGGVGGIPMFQQGIGAAIPASSITPAVAPAVLGLGLLGRGALVAGGRKVVGMLAAPAVRSLLIGFGGQALYDYFAGGGKVSLPGGRGLRAPSFGKSCGPPRVFVRRKRCGC